MSVDTYLKGKNLEPYRRALAGADLQVLVAPELLKLATAMRIHVTGSVFKKLAATLSNGSGQDEGCAVFQEQLDRGEPSDTS
ncbi:MAG: hypothetical protein WD602_05180 [Actinomycetota bacterium]